MRVLLFSILSSLVLSGRAEAGVARATWGTEEGLPSGSVNDIEVGRDGYLWIATYDGLARFDGARFTVFDADTTPGMPTNRIVFVREAPDGAIWMGTETGAVVRRDAATGEVRSWSLLPGDRPPPLLLARDGGVWTVARGGVARFDGQEFVYVPFEGADDAPAVSVAEGPDGAIWVGFANHFVARRDGSGVRWFRTADGRHYGTREVVVGPDGGVWVVTYDAVLQVRGDGLVPVDPSWDDSFESVWPVGPDEAWVGASSGLSHWKDGRRALVVPSDPAYGARHLGVAVDTAGHTWALGATGVLKDGVLVSGATGELWSDLVADPTGGVWVGSGSHGLMRLRDAPMETLGPAASPGLEGVYGLAEGADGAVWAGTMDNGLYRIAEGGIEQFIDPGVPHRGVLSTLQDPDGTVWAGLLDVGLARVAGDHLERVPGLPDGTVRLIERLSDGTLLASIGDTFWRRTGGNWAPMTTDPPLPSVPVRAALETDGVLWLATGGAGLLRVEGARMTRFSRAEGFPSDTLRSLWRSAEGTLWIGTEDRGLLGWAPGASAPRRLSTREGLPDHSVHAIVADGLGAVWGSTNKGLFRVAEADLEAYARGAHAVDVTTFGVADGMAGEEANGGVARTACPPSPRLRGEGRGGGPPDEVEVAVADSGPGVPPEVRARLFERFHTAGESSVQAGSGIGLSLARDLTERHDGRIVVESVEGQGSTFTVVLPRSAATVPAVEGPVTPASPAPELEEGADGKVEEDDRTTVLVADDHPEVRAWIRAHLAARYRVIEAANGREALALARRALPDLVISDVMMPELDGFGLVRGLRADPELDTVPIVMLTARGSDESRVEGLRRGADAWLTKPFSSTVLVAQVDGLLAQRRLLAERLGPSAVVDVDEAEMSADDRYLRKVKATIEAKLHDPAFGVEELADAVAQNRAHLFRRVKELTGEAPSTMLRVARLERAATLLARRTASVGEIAYAVGFNGLSSFSRAFRDHYGVTPTAWGTELR